MDDNATFFISQRAVNEMQDVFEEYRPAGLRVKQHKCCAFLTEKGLQLGHGTASWARAAAQTLKLSKNKRFVALGALYRFLEKESGF